jgi:hypothetical protein
MTKSLIFHSYSNLKIYRLKCLVSTIDLFFKICATYLTSMEYWCFKSVSPNLYSYETLAVGIVPGTKAFSPCTPPLLRFGYKKYTRCTHSTTCIHHERVP